MTLYFSKWRKKWVPFKNQPPCVGEILKMQEYKYEIKEVK